MILGESTHSNSSSLLGEEALSPFAIAPSSLLSSSQPANIESMQLDPQMLRKTEARIGQLVHELAIKSRSDQSIDSFLADFLPVASSAMLSVGIGIWRWSSKSNEWRSVACLRLPVELVEDLHAEKDLSGTVCLDSLLPSKSQLAILDAVDRDQQPVVVPPLGTPLPPNRPANPTENLLIISPIPYEHPEQRWLLQVVQRPCGGPATQRGYLRFVAQLADLVGDFMKADRLRQLEREKGLLQLSEKLLHRLSTVRSHSVHLRDLCDTFRHASQADQAFLLHRNDGRNQNWKLAAISGLDEVDPRAEGTEIVERTITKLANSEQQESPLVSSQLLSARMGRLRQEESLDGQFDEFFRVFQAKVLYWAWIHFSLKEGQPLVCVAWMDRHQTPCPLTIEQVGFLFRLGLSASQVPWYRRLLAQTKPTIRQKLDPTLWTTKTKWLTVAGSLLTFAFVPVPMSIVGTGLLHPSQVQYHFAPSDAIVRSLEVDESEWIEPGQVFLSSEIDEALGMIAKNRERVTEIESRLLRDDRLPSVQRDPLESEAEMLKQSLVTQQRRLEHLQARAQKLNIKANFRSRLNQLHAKQELTGRPVKRGQYLLSTHNPEGPWYIEARFRERDLPYLQKNLRTPEASSAVLTSQPSKQYQVTWQISATHAVDGDGSQADKSILVRFHFDSSTEAELHDGASARVQVRCGSTPLAWLLFRDIFQSAWAKVRMWM